MNYDKPSLAKFLEPGNVDAFPNGSSGFLLVGTGENTLPEWKSLEDANVAAKNHTHLYAGSTTAGGAANAARTLYLGDGIFRVSTDLVVNGKNLNIDALNANGLFIYGDDDQPGRWMEEGLVFQLSSQDEPVPGTSAHHLFQLWSSFDNRLGVRWRNNTGAWTPIETILTSANWDLVSDIGSTYLPLAGGVMTGPISSKVVESNGYYSSVAWASITVAEVGSTGKGIFFLETPIAANASSGRIVPASNDGEQFLQIRIKGIDISNKGKTVDIVIGAGISVGGALNVSTSGWSSYGTVTPVSITPGVVDSSRHAFKIELPSGSYRLNVDCFFDYLIDKTHPETFVSQFIAQAICAEGSESGGWCFAPDADSHVVLGANTLNHFIVSHKHVLTDITDITPGSANKQFLKYSISNGVGSYSFVAITANDIPNIEDLNASAGSAGKLLVSKASGAEWLPTGANGNFLKQTASGPAYTAITSADISDLSTTIAAALPSAYDSAAEPLGAVASSGLSNSYSRGDHIHPLPFMVPTAERFFKPIKIGLTGAVTAEAVELDGTNDIVLNVTRIDPYLFDITLPVALGGTGRTTLDAYKLLVGNGTSAVAFVENGTNSSYFLKTGAGNVAPSFAAVTWSDVTSKPTSFTPSSHTHGVSDVKSDSGVAQALLITHPTKTASESVGTTAGSVGQVPYQKATGNNAEIGWLTPRLRDARAYYGIAGNSPSSITHIAGHDTLVYIVENPTLGSGQTSYTCEVTVPTPTVEGDEIELHLVSQAAAGIVGKLKISTNGILYMKDNALVSSSSSNILQVGHGQYITLRAIAITSSNRNSSIFTWLAKVTNEVNL